MCNLVPIIWKIEMSSLNYYNNIINPTCWIEDFGLHFSDFCLQFHYNLHQITVFFQKASEEFLGTWTCKIKLCEKTILQSELILNGLQLYKTSEGFIRKNLDINKHKTLNGLLDKWVIKNKSPEQSDYIPGAPQSF